MMQDVTVRRGPGGRVAAAQQAQGRAELDMLTAQRAELQSQLKQMASRRNQLDEQRHVAPSIAARRELESRMSEIDARSARLDQQIASLNDRIVEAMGRVGGGGGGQGVGVGGGPPVIVDVPRITIPEISVPPFGRQRGFDMRQVGGMMAMEAVLLAVIGLAFWRFGMRRMRDQFERAFASQSTQLNQLQQAVDTVAIEVERISEGQRFVAKVLNEGAPAAGALLGRKASEPAPSSRNG